MSGAAPHPPPPPPPQAVNFGDGPGDVQVTSSDGVAFSLHRENLRAHSQTFRDLLDASGDAPASVTLDEPAAVLDCVFRFCYPSLGTSDFARTDTFRLIECGRAAHKYQLGTLRLIVSQELQLRFGYDSQGIEAAARSYSFAHVAEDFALMKLCADALVQEGFGPFEHDAAHRYGLTLQAWEQLRTFLLARRAAIVEKIVSASSLLVQHVEGNGRCEGQRAWEMMALALLDHLSIWPSQPMLAVPDDVRSALVATQCEGCHHALTYVRARLTSDRPGIPDDVNAPTWAERP